MAATSDARSDRKEVINMSVEENKALTNRFAGAWATGDLAVMDEVLAPNFVFHAPPSRSGVR